MPDLEMAGAMGKDKTNRLAPLPSRSFFNVIVYLLFQMIWVPIQRLFSIKVIKGWSRSTQISVNYLRYGIDNELHHARKAEQTTTWLLNKNVKECLIDLVHDDFHGSYIGSEPKPEDAAIVLYLHGGGYFLCEVKTYLTGILDIRNAFRAKTNRNLSFFCLEYTRAPEAKFPTQINEAIAAYKYLRQTFPTQPIIVLGDSAGGSLTWRFFYR